VATDPDRRIGELSLLSAEERQRVLVDWNATGSEYPRDRCVHELFEEQVARTPDAVAVVCGGEELTYRELDERANRLAHYLRRLGVGPEQLVGVCVERSLGVVVALLGVLKAGGAYLPLDPGYPAERLAFMLRDSGAQVLVTEERLLGGLPVQVAAVVYLDRDAAVLQAEAADAPASGVVPDNLAYIIYTSGSTGTPKGVMVPHHGIVSLLFGVEYVDLGPTATLLHVAPFTFDASTFEIWGALLHGGRCVLFPGTVPTIDELSRVLQRHQINRLFLTTSLFNLLIDEAPEALSHVRQLLTGGEAMSVPRVRRARELLPDTQVSNIYGPTECTTFASWYPVLAPPDETARSIPIGRPLAGRSLYVLDAWSDVVPIGAPGELYVGGEGIARGYAGRPSLTAAKFVPNPFGPAGSRLYRTGDLATWLPDGAIDFLGRIDDQVKIRGFRIEPGEIEATLAAHPSVREAAVSVRIDESGAARLVVFLVPRSPGELDGTSVREFLSQRLPEYMVPSVYVTLEQLPLTPNRKLDRTALPDPHPSQSDDQSGYVPPSTPVEEALAGIWADVLGLKRVGMHDDFFELGGDSLQAMRILARIESTLGVALPVASFFEMTSLGEAAQAVEQLAASSSS